MVQVNPRSNRFRLHRLMVTCLAAALFSACLKPDAVGGHSRVDEPQTVREPVLLAGATSSTNWPEEIQHSILITVKARTDSVVTLYFAMAREQDTGYYLVPVSGTLKVFDGSGIPALDSVPSLEMEFENVDSLVVPGYLIRTLPGHGGDTISFNLFIQVDTTRCFIPGFLYSKSSAKIVHSILPDNPPSTFQLKVPRFGYEAKLDTSGVTHIFPPGPGTEFSFYIPGSPYYWRPEPYGTLLFGPLSEGPYPLRLIIVGPANGDPSASRVDIYEITLRPRQPSINGQPSKPPAFLIGRKILSTEFASRLVLRPEAP